MTLPASTNLVQCPKCSHEFAVTEAILAKINREAEAGIEARVQAEREKLQRDLHDKLKAETERLAREKREADEQALRLREEAVAAALKLEKDRQSHEAQLQAEREAAKQKSIDELLEKLSAAQKQNEELAAKERLAGIEARQKANEDAQKRFDERAAELQHKIEQEAKLKSAELELQLGTLRKQLEEANKRVNQGSMQNQGAALEATFAEELRVAFPRDVVSDVPTGVNGADVILDVFNDAGTACGRIVFENKRTAAWSDGWTSKLREDMHTVGAAVGVIITQVLPKDIKSSGLKEGIWVSDFGSAMTLIRTLRWGLQEAALQKRISAQADNASAMLYEFVTGPDFRNRVQSIMQTYTAMRDLLEKERRAMQKIWKHREAQLERLTGHTTHVITHIESRTGREIDGGPLAALEDVAIEVEDDFGDTTTDDDAALPSPDGEASRDQFLAALRSAGGSSGNVSLRAALGWDEAQYSAVKDALIAGGAVEPGRGRGGSVKIAGLED